MSKNQEPGGDGNTPLPMEGAPGRKSGRSWVFRIGIGIVILVFLLLIIGVVQFISSKDTGAPQQQDGKAGAGQGIETIFGPTARPY
ncbi:hypothetical protein [Paenibacillus sp. D9]|uniref:hypothetical protein n=1 Tax=Paenibacillus TaxID=44249 RepID=UPI00061E8F70|nr:hypothetical protein [Paenibacillus sp. D9]KKC48690.1 hypothetical protein VE23_18985 [Paenibacillus sp. D9]